MKKIILITLMATSLFTNYIYGKIILIPYNYPTIQTGIDYANAGDTLLVSPGTYLENINFQGKEIVVASTYLFTKDTSVISQTIIDGNQLDFVVTFENDEDSNSILTGFTITNGGLDSVSLLGGGIFCNNASPVIQNNHIVFNYPKGCKAVGAIYCINSSAYIFGNIITNNSGISADHGAGIVCITSKPTISENIISQNTFSFVSYAAGIYCSESVPRIENNSIIANYGGYVFTGGGGIICVNESDVFIKFNIIANNSFDAMQAGIFVKNSDTYVNNNTIYGNLRGIIALDTSNVYINNSIIWEVPSPNNSVYAEAGSFIWSRYTDVQDTLWVFNNCGNINIDPLFVDPSNNDFRLQPNSPCIDAGDPFKPNDPDGTRADMGAFYYDQSTGLNDNSFIGAQRNIKAYPNPFSNFTTIEFENKNNENHTLIIYNTNGQLVRKIDNITNGRIIFERENLKSGSYFFQLMNNTDKIRTGKVFVN